MKTSPIGDANSKQVRAAQSTILSRANETTPSQVSTVHSTVYIELNSTSDDDPFTLDGHGYETHAAFALDRKKTVAFLKACSALQCDPEDLLQDAIERCCNETIGRAAQK